MTDIKGPYRAGAFFVALSGVLHLLSPILGGFGPQMLGLAAIGVLYLLFGFGLMQGWRWLAYLLFLWMLVGVSVSIALIWNGALPAWLPTGFAMADGAAALALFLALWRPAQG
ncbi:hypothetical protein IV417_11755 [Alphaproteobacteria bacterium KMM 3653]|uniref:Uncharacterized protein n=1 Tax=Harenicola maris TaxID=2841044 RepID=A0AAP2G4L9_9RHOB|nr:hypothetical protein [Harenicola maris]